MSINVEILRSLLIAVDTGDVATIKSHGIGVVHSHHVSSNSNVSILGWIFCGRSFIEKAYHNWFSLKYGPL